MGYDEPSMQPATESLAAASAVWMEQMLYPASKNQGHPMIYPVDILKSIACGHQSCSKGGLATIKPLAVSMKLSNFKKPSCPLWNSTVWGCMPIFEATWNLEGLVSHHHLQLHVKGDITDMETWHPDKVSLTHTLEDARWPGQTLNMIGATVDKRSKMRTGGVEEGRIGCGRCSAGASHPAASMSPRDGKHVAA